MVERRPYPLFIYGLVLVIIMAVEAVLVIIGAVSLPIIGAVMVLLPVYLIVALWLGSWGLIAGFFGWFLARIAMAGFAIPDSQVVLLALLSAFQGLVLIAVPMAVLSFAGADLDMARARDVVVLCTGLVLAYVFYIIWTYLSGILAAIIISGTIPPAYLSDPAALILHMAGENFLTVFIPLFILTPVLLRVLTPYARHTILYLRNS